MNIVNLQKHKIKDYELVAGCLLVARRYLVAVIPDPRAARTRSLRFSPSVSLEVTDTLTRTLDRARGHQGCSVRAVRKW